MGPCRFESSAAARKLLRSGSVRRSGMGYSARLARVEAGRAPGVGLRPLSGGGSPADDGATMDTPARGAWPHRAIGRSTGRQAGLRQLVGFGGRASRGTARCNPVVLRAPLMNGCVDPAARRSSSERVEGRAWQPGQTQKNAGSSGRLAARQGENGHGGLPLEPLNATPRQFEPRRLSAKIARSRHGARSQRGPSPRTARLSSSL